MSSMATFHFLELKNHYPDFKLFQPMLSYEIDSLSMEATGLDFTEDGNLLFVGESKRKASTSIINKVRQDIIINIFAFIIVFQFFRHN